MNSQINTTANKNLIPVMNSSIVIEHKNKIYNAFYCDLNVGYFVLPIDSFNTDFGFWVPFSKCKILEN